MRRILLCLSLTRSVFAAIQDTVSLSTRESSSGSGCTRMNVSLIPHSSGKGCSVQSIDLDFSDDPNNRKPATTIPWATINDLAAQLDIQVLRLTLRSTEDVLEFHKEFSVPKMLHFHRALTRIEYQVIVGDYVVGRPIKICDDQTVEVIGTSKPLT